MGCITTKGNQHQHNDHLILSEAQWSIQLSATEHLILLVSSVIACWPYWAQGEGEKGSWFWKYNHVATLVCVCVSVCNWEGRGRRWRRTDTLFWTEWLACITRTPLAAKPAGLSAPHWHQVVCPSITVMVAIVAQTGSHSYFWPKYWTLLILDLGSALTKGQLLLCQASTVTELFQQPLGPVCGVSLISEARRKGSAYIYSKGNLA